MKIKRSLSNLLTLLRNSKIKKYIIPLITSLILLATIYTYSEGLKSREELVIPAIGFKNYNISDNGTIRLVFTTKGQVHFTYVETLIISIDNTSIVYQNLTTTNNVIVFNLDPSILAKMCFNNKLLRLQGTIRLTYLNYTLRLYLNEIHIRYPCNISLNINVSENKVVIYGSSYQWLKYVPLRVYATIRSIKYVNKVPRVVEFKKLTLLYNGEPLIIHLKTYDKVYVSIRYTILGKTMLRTLSYAKEYP